MQPISFLEFTPPFADVFIGYILYYIAGLIAFAAIIPLEAIVLRLLKWGSFGYSLLDSFLINLASIIVGFGLAIAGIPFAISPPGSLVLSLLFALALSIIIEGAILWMLRKKSLQETLLAAVMINVVSYVCIALLLLLL
jgi:hypothetical protein